MKRESADDIQDNKVQSHLRTKLTSALPKYCTQNLYDDKEIQVLNMSKGKISSPIEKRKTTRKIFTSAHT